jgi:hypothetical protein
MTQQVTKKRDTNNLTLVSGNEKVDKPKASPKRMSISLTGNAAEVLDELAKSQDITQNEALRKAIGTEAYIRREISNGSRIVVIRADGKEVDVVFR